MVFKKNIWIIFYTILGISLLGLFWLTYTKKESLYREYTAQLESVVALYSNSFESTIVQNELLLDVLGSRLLENDLYQDQVKTHDLLKKMLSSNVSFAGFGLADPQGNLIAVSANMDVSKLPNLLALPEAKEDFLATLNSERVVLGKNYFFEPLNDWVLPLRKALRDAQGKVIAVMITGISVSKDEFFSRSNLTDKSAAFMFINAANLNRFYISGVAQDQYSKFYSLPVNPTIFKKAKDSIYATYGLTMEDLKRTGKTVSFTGFSEVTQKNSVGSVVYNQKFNFWTVLMSSQEVLTQKLVNHFLLYFLILALTNAVIFWLFWIIANYEHHSRQKLIFEANHDPLTGLLNRNVLKSHHHTFKFSDAKLSILFVDLDNFKTINDNFGHHIGDAILIKVAERLKNFVTLDGQIIRFGGDEFVVLVFEEIDEMAFSLSIIEELSKPYCVNDVRFNLGASVGIAKRFNDESIDILLSQADMAMFSAKKRKNSAELYSDKLKNISERKMHIEQQLRWALKHDEIYMVYQPQMKRDGTLHGVESLVRWQNPTLGQVAPTEFISIAEDIGIMPELGRFITECSISSIAKLQRQLNLSFKVSVNVSVKQLLDGQFYEHLFGVLKQHDFLPSNLTLEVTESLFVEEFETIVPLLNRIKEQGVWISLDDFGTGYSSLSLLRKLPIDELKIDKSFVDEIDQNERDRSLVQSILNIAENLGMLSLVEGVETAAQETILAGLGCEIFQGYYFSKPLSQADLWAFIQQNHLVTTLDV